MTEEELNAARKIKDQIDRMVTNMDNMRATGGLRSSLSSPVVRAGKAVNVGQTIVEMGDKIQSLKNDFVFEQEKIRRSIEKVELEFFEKEVAMMFYVNCLTIREILDCIPGYSERQLKRFKKNAVKKIERK